MGYTVYFGTKSNSENLSLEQWILKYWFRKDLQAVPSFAGHISRTVKNFSVAGLDGFWIEDKTTPADGLTIFLNASKSRQVIFFIFYGIGGTIDFNASIPEMISIVNSLKI